MLIIILVLIVVFALVSNGAEQDRKMEERRDEWETKNGHYY
jgi:hypothetical protein